MYLPCGPAETTVGDQTTASAGRKFALQLCTGKKKSCSQDPERMGVLDYWGDNDLWNTICAQKK
jgi:hypothetical protein